MDHSEEQVKHSKIWGTVTVICVVVLILGISIGCTISSVRSAQRDEAIKTAAAENGCDYINGEVFCHRPPTQE